MTVENDIRTNKGRVVMKSITTGTADVPKRGDEWIRNNSIDTIDTIDFPSFLWNVSVA